MIKEMTVMVTIPGTTTGVTTFRKACIKLHPSIIAASSSSLGTAIKNPDNIKIAVGSANVIWGMITAI
ncbi:MAG: hypothetical protein RHS_5276 [Robinsoniella sp. RHS]|nr:MAG: hypothetical protein RHS_5276 [Robinsoniella sp. RHS]